MILPSLLREVQRLGHAVFTGADYDMNIIVQRGPNRRAGQMDDLISLVFREAGRWVEECYTCSADPGPYYLKNQINPKGTAIIAPGQYRRAYQLGLHKGRPALIQVGPITVRRDADGDDILEPGESDTGLFAVNVHDGETANASAGCIVLSRVYVPEFLRLLALQKNAGYGDRYTLTVIEVA